MKRVEHPWASWLRYCHPLHMPSGQLLYAMCDTGTVHQYFVMSLVILVSTNTPATLVNYVHHELFTDV